MDKQDIERAISTRNMWRRLPLVVGLLVLLLLGILDIFPYRRSSEFKAVTVKDEVIQGVVPYLIGIIRRLDPDSDKDDENADPSQDRNEIRPPDNALATSTVYEYNNLEAEGSRNQNFGPEAIGPSFKSKSVGRLNFPPGQSIETEINLEVALEDLGLPSGSQAYMTKATYEYLVNNEKVYEPGTELSDDTNELPPPADSTKAVDTLIDNMERPIQKGGLLNYEGKGTFNNPFQKLQRKGRGDITQPPSNANVGHTIAQHVLLDAFDRITTEPIIRAAHFESLESANRAIATALTENKDDIIKWLEGLEADNLNSVYDPDKVDQNDERLFTKLISSQVPEVNGVVYKKNTKKIDKNGAAKITKLDPPTEVKVILGVFDTWYLPQAGKLQEGEKRTYVKTERHDTPPRFIPRIVTAYPNTPAAPPMPAAPPA